MVVVLPRPGSTQPYALTCDRVARTSWVYQTASAVGTSELWRWVARPRSTWTSC